MASNGVTKEMFENVKAMLKIYKDKAATHGATSLTTDDAFNLRNIGKVMETFEAAALEEIVRNAIMGDYSKVVEYYTEKEKDFAERIVESEETLTKISDQMVEAVAFNDKEALARLGEGYNFFRSKIQGLNVEFDEFMKSRLSQEDFVKKIMQGNNSERLVRGAISNIINTSTYLISPREYNEPTKFYSRDERGKVAINDNLVHLAIDFINGKSDDFDNIKRIACLREWFRNKKNKFETQIYTFKTTFKEYQRAKEKFATYSSALENVRFSRSRIKKGPEEIIGYRKYDIEEKLNDLNSKIYLSDSIINNALVDAKRTLGGRVPNFPSNSEIFASEESLTAFIEMISAQYDQLISEERMAMEKEIAELSSKTKPEYIGLNYMDINRLAYYGRGRLDTDEFIRIRENLELLHAVSTVKNGVENPQDIVSAEMSEVYETKAHQAIEDTILPRTI